MTIHFYAHIIIYILLENNLMKLERMVFHRRIDDAGSRRPRTC